MSESMQITTAILAFLTLVFNGVMGYLFAKMQSQQRAVEVKVDTAARMAQSAATTTAAQGVTLSEIKSLANGQNDRLRAERDAAAAEVKRLLAALPPDHPAAKGA